MVITYVTITYNAAQVLQRTLDSVLQQDYRDIVHLIIDGASTDGTLQIVDDYIQRSNAADNGHRIQVTSEPDHGIYDAMNKGIRSLDGDYVCFLNAGDFLPASDTVSRIVASLSHNGDCPLCEERSGLQGDCPQCDLPAVPKRISSTPKAASCAPAVSLPLSTSPGNLSVTACSSVIRPSTPVPTLPSPRLTTFAIVTLPMSIGASAS